MFVVALVHVLGNCLSGLRTCLNQINNSFKCLAGLSGVYIRRKSYSTHDNYVFISIKKKNNQYNGLLEHFTYTWNRGGKK